MDERELGRFLRSRRDAVSPADVGLPAGTRRRTPGLRRAEVATLAGISVDYLVRLEQGCDRRPSAAVLAALANALRLSDEDREHLRQLASITHRAELCPSDAGVAARTVRPAFVLNRLSDVLAWTAGYDGLARPLGIFDCDPPNLVAFTSATS